MSSEFDKREVCPRCGWVGRRAFRQDRHDLCEAPPEDPPSADEDLDEGDEDEERVETDDGKGEDAEDEDEGTALAPERRTSARRRGVPSKKTLAVRRITRLSLAAGRAELEALGADGSYDRPHTRGECANVPRPCPYVACKYSLYLDVSETGSIILNFPHLEPGQMPADQSCALDLAERGSMTLENIAVVTNLTRERIRQIELKANRQVRSLAVAMGLEPEDVSTRSHRPQERPEDVSTRRPRQQEGPEDVSTWSPRQQEKPRASREDRDVGPENAELREDHGVEPKSDTSRSPREVSKNTGIRRPRRQDTSELDYLKIDLDEELSVVEEFDIREDPGLKEEARVARSMHPHEDSLYLDPEVSVRGAVVGVKEVDE